MRNVHQLIARRGLEAARKLAATKTERMCIEAAAAVHAAGPCRPGDTGYAVLGSSCFPHKSLDRTALPSRWEGKIDNVAIAIDSGRYADGGLIGVPYGSKARIIMLYLTTAAVTSDSPEIELGASMYAWLRRMSASQFGGMTYRLFAEQARRITAMTIHARVEGDGVNTALSGHSIAELIQTDAPSGAEPHSAADFPHRVRLDPGYWRAAKLHSCAIRLCALRSLGNNGTAIDLYVWLAHRLPRLQRNEPVGWSQLHTMFGSGFRHLRQMKGPFLSALNLALAVYPDAQVEADTAGISLFPSAPPVPTALSRIGDNPGNAFSVLHPVSNNLPEPQ